MRISALLNASTSTAQRIVALVVLFAAVTAFALGLVWPLWHAYGTQLQWRTDAARSLARARGLIEIDDVVRAQTEALPHLEGWRKFYRTGDAGAVAALQSDIEGTVARAHAQPQTFSPLSPTPSGTMQKIGIHVVAAMNVESLRAFLADLGELQHFIRVGDIVVNAPLSQSPHENATLIVTADLYGFALDDKVFGRDPP